MTRWLPAIAAAALACGDDKGDPEPISVTLTLDADSCATGAPEELRFDCPAMAGVWLRDDDGTDRGRACADLGQGQNLLGIAGLLEPLVLAEPDGDLTIEVAVYGSWTAQDGCLAPDELPDGAPPPVIVRGASAPVRLESVEGRVPIALTCDPESIVSPEEAGASAACREECRNTELVCNRGDRVEPCFAEGGPDDDWFDCLFDQECVDLNCESRCLDDDGYFECALACVDDQACGDECEKLGRPCFQAFPEGACELCPYNCDYADAACRATCANDYTPCVEMACAQESVGCEAACPGTDGVCASVIGP